MVIVLDFLHKKTRRTCERSIARNSCDYFIHVALGLARILVGVRKHVYKPLAVFAGLQKQPPRPHPTDSRLSSHQRFCCRDYNDARIQFNRKQTACSALLCRFDGASNTLVSTRYCRRNRLHATIQRKLSCPTRPVEVEPDCTSMNA